MGFQASFIKPECVKKGITEEEAINMSTAKSMADKRHVQDVIRKLDGVQVIEDLTHLVWYLPKDQGIAHIFILGVKDVCETVYCDFSCPGSDIIRFYDLLYNAFGVNIMVNQEEKFFPPKAFEAYVREKALDGRKIESKYRPLRF